MIFRYVGILPGTEGRDLDDLAAELHVRKAEAAADQPAVAKRLTHLLRAGVGGDVEVLGFAAQKQIAYPTADQVCFEPGCLEAIKNLQRVGRDVGP